ncbi:AAA family ATPase [Epibacterium ulvae]|uniref:AAA family ATPase n=1 Tax=Epibacterium ulvae TaxID=1156985 RepID=UPI0024909030|nr:ATP-binding protein [Epibacterium ulvae]
MRKTFVKTQNYHAFAAGLKRVEERGAEESLFMIVDGKPGLGKTTILERFAAQNHCVHLRTKKHWDGDWFIEDLLEGLGIAKPYRKTERHRAALKGLAERKLLADSTQQQFLLMVDEADHISARGAVLEVIRELIELAEVPCILIGMGRIRDNLTKFPQIISRRSAYVQFQQAPLEDVELMLKELCEVPVASDLASFALKATKGYHRELKDVIKSIEKFGRRTPPADPEIGLTLREMAGVELIRDRQTDRPILVPGAAK